MQFGTAVHLIFENPDWRDVVMVAPKFDLRKKANKELKRQFYEDNQGKAFVSEDEMKALARIERNAQAKPKLQALLDGARSDSPRWGSQ
jgi:hypothetical protein